MKKFFANIWTKRVVSLLSAAYAFMACFLCYCSLFYSIDVHSNAGVCLMTTGISLIGLVAMLYSRKQIITKIASFVILPAMLPVVLFYFGEWFLIIPIVITGILIFLLSGAGEGIKTALGTVFLLLYIFGSLGYFLANSLFVTATKKEQIYSGASPSGKYRCYVINTKDSSNGSTAVYVEPDDADKSFKYVDFNIKNMQRIVYLERPLIDPEKSPMELKWETKTRQQITEEIEAISSEVVVHLSQAQLKKLGYTYEDKLILCGLTDEQYQAIGKSKGNDIYLNDLTAEQLAVLSLAKDDKGYYVPDPAPEIFEQLDLKKGPVYIKDMNDAWRAEYNVEKVDSVLLSSLSDKDLADFGVPESGDVLYFNGKPCFRYYVAVLENYFDLDHKSLSLF